MKFQKKRILSLLGVLSALFLFSCGEKKQDIYLECYTYDIFDGKFGENSEVSIKLDLEDRRAAYKYKRQNINTDKKLSVSDTHYSSYSYTPNYTKFSKYEVLDEHEEWLRRNAVCLDIASVKFVIDVNRPRYQRGFSKYLIPKSQISYN